MKILAVTPTFGPSVGGIEHVVEEIANRGNLRGIVTDVLHLKQGLKKGIERYNGITVFRAPLWGGRLLGIGDARHVPWDAYDIIHVHDPQLMSITNTVRLFNRGGVPSVLSTHGGFRHTNRFAVFKWLFEIFALRFQLTNYAAVLCSSKSDYGYFRRYCGQAVPCENGVRVSAFHGVERSGNSTAVNWLYWGRIAPNKKLEDGLRLVRQARDLGQDVQLTIAGDGTEAQVEYLRMTAAELGIAKSIRFCGRVSDLELRELLRMHSVFLLPSAYEGFGLTVVEALAAGMHVLCRDIAPINAFFTDGVEGRLLRFDGAAEDRAKLESLFSLNEREFEAASSQARMRAKAFDWEIAAEHFFESYRAATAAR